MLKALEILFDSSTAESESMLPGTNDPSRPADQYCGFGDSFGMKFRIVNLVLRVDKASRVQFDDFLDKMTCRVDCLAFLQRKDK
jgi:hypothetical protein